jgi:hypothetical protein
MFPYTNHTSLPKYQTVFLCVFPRGKDSRLHQQTEHNIRVRVTIATPRRQVRHSRGQLFRSSTSQRRDTSHLVAGSPCPARARHRWPAARCVRRWASSDRNGCNVETEAGEPGCRVPLLAAPPFASILLLLRRTHPRNPDVKWYRKKVKWEHLTACFFIIFDRLFYLNYIH